MAKLNIKDVAAAALPHITGLLNEWLPGGKVINSEYVVRNPLRDDEHAGSFSVNMSTGSFNDYADSTAKGGDLVALYAWLHGIGQYDACKEVAARIGLVDAPDGVKPRPLPVVKIEKKPAALRPVVPAPFPVPDAVLNGGRNGKPDAVYTYKARDGKILGYVCRFNRDGGKDIKPLFWFGKQWRWKGFSGDMPRPLYGMERLADESKTIIVVEGEKAADAGQSMLPEYTWVSWLGGTSAAKKAIWQVLKGRKVIIWPDNDDVGQKAAQVIQDNLPQARIINLPHDLPKGFDVADCADAKQASDILEYKPPEPMTEAQIEDTLADNKHFKLLGFIHADGKFKYVFYSKSHKSITYCSAERITYEKLCEVAPWHYWQMTFMSDSKKGTIDAARSAIIGLCCSIGMFNPDRLRGRGIWFDEDRVIAHLGNRLMVDGVITQLHGVKTDYIYQQGKRLQLDGVPIEASQGYGLVQLLELLEWEDPISAWLLAGWIFLAPVCGGLRWRPHLWLTGEAGAGKSWVFQNIVREALGDFAISVQSQSTAAGIRQYVGCDAMPVVFDEAESEDKRNSERIQQILSLARGSSSMDGGALVQGSAGGHAAKYELKSMFAFASILPNIQQTADDGRVAILTLKKKKGDPTTIKEHFEKVKSARRQLFTPDFINGLKMRALQRLPEIRKAVSVFTPVATDFLGSARLGDQIGTLLAGCYVLQDDATPTADEARAMMSAGTWSMYFGDSGESDHDKALQYLLQSMIKNSLNHEERTVSEWIAQAVEVERMTLGDKYGVVDLLSRYGLFVKDGGLRIANQNRQLKQLFRDTPWAHKWNNTFKHMEGVVKPDKPLYMGKAHPVARGLILPLSHITNEENS